MAPSLYNPLSGLRHYFLITTHPPIFMYTVLWILWTSQRLCHLCVPFLIHPWGLQVWILMPHHPHTDHLLKKATRVMRWIMSSSQAWKVSRRGGPEKMQTSCRASLHSWMKRATSVTRWLHQFTTRQKDNSQTSNWSGVLVYAEFPPEDLYPHPPPANIWTAVLAFIIACSHFLYIVELSSQCMTVLKKLKFHDEVYCNETSPAGLLK